MGRIREHVIASLGKTWPASEVSPDQLIGEMLISDHVLQLPLGVLTQAEQFVKSIWTLRNSASYQKQLEKEQLERKLIRPPNASFAMSYDFHLSDNGTLKLIEINTNAAFLGLGILCDEAHQGKSNTKLRAEIRKTLENEMLLFWKGRLPENPRIAIVDRHPREQKLFVEFLFYQQLFRSYGWTCEILDSTSEVKNFDLIYNRDTDFYLEEPDHSLLRQDWCSGRILLSPHPYEYFLLADKQRLLDWVSLELDPSQVLQKNLPMAQPLNIENSEQIWNQRKSLFFKPKRSFGSKQSYKGEKISRKLFAEISHQDMIAQEYVPPGEVEVQTPEGVQKMKYDLRFYAYQDRVQFVMARLYQGQLTNTKTPFGGFACVKFLEKN